MPLSPTYPSLPARRSQNFGDEYTDLYQIQTLLWFLSLAMKIEKKIK